MTTSGSPTERRLPHRGRAWLFGVVVPVLVTAAAWVVVLRLLPRLPAQVALHWGVDGVDRVGTHTELLREAGVIGGVSLVVLAVLSLATGRTALVRRLVLGLATGCAVFFAGILLTQVLLQVGLDDPFQAGSPDGGFLLTVVAALAAGALAGALAGADPGLPAVEAVPADAPRTALGAHERAVWTRQAGPSGRSRRWIWFAVLVYAAASLGFAVLTQSWFVAVIMLVIVPVALTMLVWDVRVDAAGLTARGSFGWPRQHVPAAEVVRAHVRDVSPIREFGGWGLRSAMDGTVGVVVRRGAAIVVELTGGRRLVVTVDDAAAGAALLNTYAERARGNAPRTPDGGGATAQGAGAATV
ncbi:DUF1648 domain-containing protein [Georgenia yuyongxinii]|uniref:DUF1648 domain-containing protein n=1 Tax=Georgenia yuyongxinii TaxID=2589797 RepID=A0A552WMA4_9MICO|nr:DUF1648 domain-containing protein [Georgenia yuyongxinii]TRW43824.1 DUF1648 domain-containing protein [Georgenia yuyongxinii]